MIALVLAVKLVKLVRSALHITFTQTFLWYDSKCALSWVLNLSNILPVFIQRRVDTIRECANVSFRYTPSQMNPADLPSRGATLSDLCNSNWWSGPVWLTGSEWPPEFQPIVVNDVTTEHKILFAHLPVYRPPFEIDISRFRDLLVLFRITARALSFIASFSLSDRLSVCHTTERPMIQAERWWIRTEQLYHYMKSLLRSKIKRVTRSFPNFAFLLMSTVLFVQHID